MWTEPEIEFKCGLCSMKRSLNNLKKKKKSQSWRQNLIKKFFLLGFSLHLTLLESYKHPTKQYSHLKVPQWKYKQKIYIADNCDQIAFALCAKQPLCEQSEQPTSSPWQHFWKYILPNRAAWCRVQISAKTFLFTVCMTSYSSSNSPQHYKNMHCRLGFHKP